MNRIPENLTKIETHQEAVASVVGHREKAEALLDHFSSYTDYGHGAANHHLSWLRNLHGISREDAIRFLCAWYPVSRHQPQILLLCAASFHEWKDRARVMSNYLEEDAQDKPGHQPHYVLLQELIGKLGGTLEINPASEKLAGSFRKSIGQMSEGYSWGLLAGVEHPALDISNILHEVIRLAGFTDLLSSDIYLTIHTRVEPEHICDAHGAALMHLESGLVAREEVLAGFQKAMAWWREFWPIAFKTLGYSPQ